MLDPISTARREHSLLREGKTKFATYYSKLTQIAGILRYTQVAKCSTLEQGIRDKFKDQMTRVFLPTDTFVEYMVLLQWIDKNLRPQKEVKAGSRIRSFTAPPTNTYHTGHRSCSLGSLPPMDLSALLNLRTACPAADQRYV